MQKLFIPTLGFITALAATDPVMAAPWNNDDDDNGWGDDDDDDDGGWDGDNDDDDGGWDGDNDGGWHGGGNDGWNGSSKGVRIRNLSFNDKGTRLVVNGQIERLKQNKPVKVLIEARGDASAQCTNPGGHSPPGKKWVDADEITVEGREQFSLGGWNKNSLDFKVSTDSISTKVKGAPDCPNWKWTEKIVDIAFTAVDITVIQNGKRVVELECYFDEPSDDGKIQGKQFDCNER